MGCTDCILAGSLDIIFIVSSYGLARKQSWQKSPPAPPGNRPGPARSDPLPHCASATAARLLACPGWRAPHGAGRGQEGDQGCRVRVYTPLQNFSCSSDNYTCIDAESRQNASTDQ